MDRTELLAFLRARALGAVSTVDANGAPQSAVVALAFTDRLEVVFDTLASTRKLQNLRRERRIAIVVWDGERTAQIEGVADEPEGDTLAALQAVYFRAFADGPARLSWPGITYVRVRPTWIRYSDFDVTPPTIVELDAEPIARLAGAT